VLITPNGKHGVIDNGTTLGVILQVIGTASSWLRHAFSDGADPPDTPTLFRLVSGDRMYFVVPARAGDAIGRVLLNYATQVDTSGQPACDFTRVRMLRLGNAYVASVPVSDKPACGPPVTTENVIYFASVSDGNGVTVSSTMYRAGAEMTFSSDFAPVLEHFPNDTFPVPAPPVCSARRR
jgi:hypothetical protein